MDPNTFKNIAEMVKDHAPEEAEFFLAMNHNGNILFCANIPRENTVKAMAHTLKLLETGKIDLFEG